MQSPTLVHRARQRWHGAPGPDPGSGEALALDPGVPRQCEAQSWHAALGPYPRTGVWEETVQGPDPVCRT